MSGTASDVLGTMSDTALMKMVLARRTVTSEIGDKIWSRIKGSLVDQGQITTFGPQNGPLLNGLWSL